MRHWFRRQLNHLPRLFKMDIIDPVTRSREGIDWLILRTVSPGKAVQSLGVHPNPSERLQLVKTLYERFESLHQALCIVSFVGAGGCFLKWLTPLAGGDSAPSNGSDPPATAAISLFIVVGCAFVLFLLGLALYRAVRLLAKERVKIILRLL